MKAICRVFTQSVKSSAEDFPNPSKAPCHVTLCDTDSPLTLRGQGSWLLTDSLMGPFCICQDESNVQDSFRRHGHVGAAFWLWGPNEIGFIFPKFNLFLICMHWMLFFPPRVRLFLFFQLGWRLERLF